MIYRAVGGEGEELRGQFNENVGTEYDKITIQVRDILTFSIKYFYFYFQGTTQPYSSFIFIHLHLFSFILISPSERFFFVLNFILNIYLDSE